MGTLFSQVVRVLVFSGEKKSVQPRGMFSALGAFVDTAENRLRESWAFRCEGETRGWRWRRIDGNARILATSQTTFATFREALDDAARHGFEYAIRRRA